MLRGSDRGDRLNGGAGNDTLNPGDADGSKDQYDEIEGSAGNDRIVFSEQSPPVWTGLSYGGLGSGITATIDGVANRATVDKGTAGTDTIVDVAKPMNSWALGVVGTSSDDVFNVTVGDGQNLHLRGDAGNDTFNIRSTGVTRLQYHRSPGGIDLDLAAGRANDDGFGGVDTINGAVQLVRCSEFDDVVRGSGNDEGFECLGGNDRIDGGGGYDRLFFHRRGGARGLLVVMGDGDEDGVATGSWNGKAFSYTFTNIEHVSGGTHFFDTFIGSDGDDTFEGRGGANLYLVGEGHDTIVYFHSENDVLWLDQDLVEDHGLTHADVIAAARQDGEDVLIDLSAYGEGTIRLTHFNVDRLRTDHFKL